MTHPRRRPIRILVSVCALALALSAVPSAASAAPLLFAQQVASGQDVSARVLQPAPAIAPSGPLRADVAVDIAMPAEYLEVRLRLSSPAGRLVYQKTEVRAGLPAGRHTIAFEYDIARLELPPGRYPLEVRILATGAEPTVLADRLLVLPTEARPLPVAVVAHVAAFPAVSADGRFSRDPAGDTGLRDDVAFLSQLALTRRAPLALAIAPVLLEQLARAGDGYETVDGAVTAADSEVAARYARTVADLRSAVTTGALTLIDLPYALPDPDGLAQMEAAEDMLAHWSRTDAVRVAVLGAQEAGPVAFVGQSPSAAVLGTLADRGSTAVLMSNEALRSQDTTVAPGAYALDAAGVTAIATDAEASAAAAAGESALYDVLFDRLMAGTPVVLWLETGPGSAGSAIEVQQALDWIDGATWLRAVDVASIATGASERAALGPRPSSHVPPLYWTSIAEARAAARAYATAVGDADADTDAVLRTMLVSESALWAGGDRAWAGAPESLALADSIVGFVTEEFAKVSIDAKDVTLSGSRGDIPLALTNGTGKPLSLTILATSEEIGLPKPAFAVAAEPAETFVTVPVNLGRIVDGEMHVAVVAGTLQLAETTVRVRASHLDRLATLGMVVLVLVVLLVFIRRRVRAADAGTIASEADDEPPSV